MKTGDKNQMLTFVTIMKTNRSLYSTMGTVGTITKSK